MARSLGRYLWRGLADQECDRNRAVKVWSSCTSVAFPHPDGLLKSHQMQGRSFSLGSSSLEFLTVREIKEILDAAAIDYRDCLEKRELANRLESHRQYLPLHLKNHLADAVRCHEAKQGMAKPAAGPTASTTDLPDHRRLQAHEQNVVSLFKRCAPSVVNITSMANARVNPYSLDVTQVPAGTGSGFVWDDAGHIVTNFHVIQRANKCLITFSNNVTCEATVVGTEPDKDLAVLKISQREGNYLMPIVVGSSQMLQVGGYECC